HDTHALRAFEVAAVDYLHKPFDDERFAVALARAKERVRAARLGTALRHLGGLGTQGPEAAPAARPPLERLDARSQGRAVFVDVRDIEYVQAEDYCVLVHARGERHLLRDSMKDLEQRLPRTFVRIHRSTLVNSACVSELVTEQDGESVVVL